MHDFKPEFDGYVKRVSQHRSVVILLYLVLTSVMAFYFSPKFLSSDMLFWLKESKEFQKTASQSYQTHHLYKLKVTVETFDDETKAALETLQSDLERRDEVLKVTSLFSNDFVQTQKQGSGSELVTVLHSESLETFKLQKLVKELHNEYSNLVDREFREFTYFISATEKPDLSRLKIPGSFRYTSNETAIAPQLILEYGLVFLFMMLILFRLMFRNYVVFFSGVLVVGVTTVLTFTLIVLLTDIDMILITMPLITISIALVDFLFFYYRWHVSQYRVDRGEALVKMLNRNILPALWTSVITVIGLGGLLLVDSDIVKLLSLSVIISSLTGYIVNLTLLPSLFSYFSLQHTHVPYAKLGYYLTKQEQRYSKSLLFGFLFLTYALFLSGIYLVFDKSSSLFTLQVEHEQVALKVPYERLDLEFVNAIDAFTVALEEEFEEEIGDVVSISKIIHSLNDANSQTESLDEEALLQTLFYMDLYGLSEKYYDDHAISLRIDLFDMDKLALIQWMKGYEGIDLFIIDHETLLGSAQYDQTVLLASSLFSALFMIGLITGIIFRSWSMVAVGFTINVIPIVWFGVMVSLLNIPLSLEMLIAMTITLGLASDATIHFAFKYFRLRNQGRSQKHALQKMYFYSGIPVIIGSAVLIILFTLFSFSEVHALASIGMFSTVLILLSLLADLLVLPVMLLFVDKYRYVGR